MDDRDAGLEPCATGGGGGWHGIEVETSCEQGVCGTCLTRVLDGEPDHRDTFMTPAERAANDQMTLCCSRAKSPVLVLDL